MEDSNFKKPALPKRKREIFEPESSTNKKRKDVSSSDSEQDLNPIDPDNDPKELFKDLKSEVKKVRSAIYWEKNVSEKVKEEYSDKLLEEIKEEYSSWFDEESGYDTTLESLQAVEEYLKSEFKSEEKVLEDKNKKDESDSKKETVESSSSNTTIESIPSDSSFDSD